MMAVRDILLLGNPQLYEASEAVDQRSLASLKPVIADLHDTMMAFRQKWGAGRAISAPQIGVMKRLIYMHIDRPVALINPCFENVSKAIFEVWDDCMSFPEILVKVERHQSCQVVYRDMNWQLQSLYLENDLAELLQHEMDHLEGTLLIERLDEDTRKVALKTLRDLQIGPPQRPASGGLTLP